MISLFFKKVNISVYVNRERFKRSAKLSFLLTAISGILFTFSVYASSTNNVVVQINNQNTVDAIDRSLLYISSTTNYSSWSPLPSSPIKEGNTSNPNGKLNALAGSYSGSVTYGIGGYSGGLDPNYQFTIHANQDTCWPDKTSFGQGLPWVYQVAVDYNIVGYTLNCYVTITSTRENNPPQNTAVQVVNQSNAGNLTKGTINLNAGATCAANNPTSCSDAVAIPLTSSSNTSPTFTFTADPASYNLNSTLNYQIDDALIGGNYNVVVSLLNGTTIPDQCKAEISPPMSGDIVYQAQATQIGSGATAYCQVNVTRTVRNSPSITVTINNQPGHPAPPDSQYSYALQNGMATAEAGGFDTTQPANVAANQILGVATLSTANGPNSDFRGEVSYIFDDYIADGGVPVNLAILLDNSSSMQTWCRATVDGKGEREYSVTTAVQDLGNNAAACTVNITSENIEIPPAYSFYPLQTLTTYGTRSWETFTINNKQYLLTDNAGLMEDHAMVYNNFYVYNPGKFAFEPDHDNPSITANVCMNFDDDKYHLMDHVYDWEHFKVNNQDYIIMANNNGIDRSFSTYGCMGTRTWTKSYLYQWTDNGFEYGCETDCEHIFTDSPLMVEYFTVGNNSFVAVAEQGLNGTSNSAIYQWNGINGFNEDPTARPGLYGVQYIESFQDNSGQTYLVFVMGGREQSAVVYQVNAAGQLSLHQGLGTGAPILPEGYGSSALVFEIEDNANTNQIYLAVGYANSVPSGTAEPIIYRWEFDSALNRSVFKAYQTLENTQFNNTLMYAFYSVNGDDYLGTAMGTQGAYAFKWDQDLQILEQRAGYEIQPAGGLNITSLTPVIVNDGQDNEHLLMALAATANATGGPIASSPIMWWRLPTSKK